MRIGLRWAAVAAVLAALLLSCAGGPRTAESTAGDAETVKKEIEVGRAALAKIAGKYGVVKNEEVTAYLNKYLKSLALYVERQELDYAAEVLATSAVNAYSLPGVYVLVTLGALRRVEEPGALAGVLAHELGHINRRHVLNHVAIEVRYSFVETLARVLAGSRQVITNSINQINEKIEERLFVEGYAASDEFEADAYAVKLLQALNVSAEPYVRYLEHLAAEADTKDLANLDATHPPITQRLARIQEMITPGLPTLQPSEAYRSYAIALQSVEVTR